MIEALEEIEPAYKMEPMSHGRTDLRKKKPKIIAVILDNCTGCAGSPACVEYCPVDSCMFWVEDEEHPPLGRIEVDPNLCIGCKLCTSKGPDGTFLEGCPWDAIEMMDVAEWESRTGVALNP
ncbi:MAG: 4Fe-4S ferredoxin [Acidobacteriota bacterium]